MVIRGSLTGELHSSPNTGMNAINLKKQEAFKMNPVTSSREPNMGTWIKIEAL